MEAQGLAHKFSFVPPLKQFGDAMTKVSDPSSAKMAAQRLWVTAVFYPR
jgi:hypothetical protein